MFNSFKHARDPYTNYVTLRELAASKNGRLRAVVAANPNLQPHMIEELASDKREAVRVAVAGNPKVSAKVWDKLQEDASEAVRQALKATHPERPAKTSHRV